MVPIFGFRSLNINRGTEIEILRSVLKRRTILVIYLQFANVHKTQYSINSHFRRYLKCVHSVAHISIEPP